MKALLLDVGGVVFRSGAEMLGEFGDPRAASVVARRGPFGPVVDPDWTALMREEITEREYWGRRCAELGGALGRDWTVPEFFDALYSGSDLVRPGALALVRDCVDADLPVGVLTNDLQAFHGGADLTSHPVFSLVDVLVDASVTGVLKPDPRAYALAVGRLGLPPAEIVFIDDMPWNVEGARAAGLRAIQLDLQAPDEAFTLARAALGLGATARRA